MHRQRLSRRITPAISSLLANMAIPASDAQEASAGRQSEGNDHELCGALYQKLAAGVSGS